MSRPQRERVEGILRPREGAEVTIWVPGENGDLLRSCSVSKMYAFLFCIAFYKLGLFVSFFE